MKRSLCIPVFGGVLLLLLLGGCGSRDARAPASVPVMLSVGDGYTVEGDNPVLVPPGGEASFKLTLDDEYTVVSVPDGSAWDEKQKTLTVCDVRYPTTVQPRVVFRAKSVRLFVENAETGGFVSASVEQGMQLSGQRITVNAAPKEGYVFTGWSLGRPAAKGGELVSSELSYTFTLEADTVMIANYASTASTVPTGGADTRLILYHANGGKIAATGETVLQQDASVAVFRSPNSLWDNGTFVRDGYVLLEYNTNADGSGTPYSLGSKLILPENEQEALLLYCIWAKETPASDFTWTGERELTITGYTGDDDRVVIPLEIGGKKVTRIAAGAFRNKSFSTLVLTKNLRTVDAGAFIGCKQMETLYLFDTVVTISDDSFDETPAWRSFILCAAMAPRYSHTVEGCYRFKWERLTLAEKNRVIVVSGSSSYQGLDTPYLEELLDDRYTVVNYGTIRTTNALFYLEAISHFTHEGDIVIQAPENSEFQLGYNGLTWKLYRDVESYNNIWRYIDISRYTLVLSQFSEYNRVRVKMQPRTYDDYSTRIDANGDMTGKRGLNRPQFHGSYTITLDEDTMSDENGANLRGVYDLIEQSGAVVYMSHAPQNLNALTERAKTRKQQTAYMEAIQRKTGIPMISDIADYIMEGQYIYDDDYHPNDIGRTMRTEQLAKDIITRLKEEKRW